MEHVKQPPFNAWNHGHGPVQVFHNLSGGPLTVATIPQDIGSEREQWLWGTRISRALCYDAVNGRRVRRAGIHGLLVGFALGVVCAGGMLVGAGWLPPSQCVQLGDYFTVPNG